MTVSREPPVRPRAAIDIGTNTVLLTIARVTQRTAEPIEAAAEPVGAATVRPVASAAKRPPALVHLDDLEEHYRITRLGQNVDRDRRLYPDAIERTLRCLQDFKSACDAAGVEEILCVGTSALRDAGGGDAFRRSAESILGCPVHAISGKDEAQLTFLGGISDLGETSDDATRVLVFDIGGGSTEIALGSKDGRIEWSQSIDVGSVRLTERYGADLAAARQEVLHQLARLSPSGVGRSEDAFVALGLAGTVTTLWAVSNKLQHYSPGSLTGATLDLSTVALWTRRLPQLTPQERQELPGMEPGRADVIPCGALLCELIMRHFGVDKIFVSDRGVRHGLLLRALVPGFLGADATS